MSSRAWMLGFALLLGIACTGGPGEEKETDAHGESEEAAGHEPGHEGEGEDSPGHPAEAGMLAVDSEVLRDLKLTTFAAELRPGGEGVTALGEIKVDERSYAEVGTPIPARVVRLVAEAGQTVRRGQVLAELQSVELGQARAQRTAALARAELARQTVERKRGLAAERIVSRGELQRSEADAASAEADLRAAEAAIAALGLPSGSPAGDLSRFALPSPIAGTVLERTAVRGQTADPARPLFRVADLSRLWLVVQAPERDAVRVREGAAAEIALAALPEGRLRGTVDWVGREVDAHSRTIPVRLVLDNRDGRLKPGMFATAWISTGGEEQVVAVPSTALQRMENQWIVFLPRGQGKFEMRPVGRGRDLGDEVAIVSGLQPGERVVVEGSFVLRTEAEKKEGGAEHHHH